MDPNDIYMQGVRESLSFWKERVDAEPNVLYVLHMQHYLKLMSSVEQSFDDLDALMDRLGDEILTAKAPWRAQPVKKTKEQINKLSRGFAMAASDVAAFFRDIDLGREIKQALLDPQTPPQSYPNMFPSAGYLFLKEVESSLPQAFWRSETDFAEIQMAMNFMNETGLSIVRGEENTPLVYFMHHQRVARVLEKAAPELKKAGKHNWATIAQALAEKNRAGENDIITRARAFSKTHDVAALPLIAEQFRLPQMRP